MTAELSDVRLVLKQAGGLVSSKWVETVGFKPSLHISFVEFQVFLDKCLSVRINVDPSEAGIK